jgi:GNAT superfamily N-acetyltransferase
VIPGDGGEHESIVIRTLQRGDLGRIGDIDRTETIRVLYEQRGTDLVARTGTWDARPWTAVGDGEHSVAALVRFVADDLDRGGVALGAFTGERMVGIGVVVPEIRPGVAQLSLLHVTSSTRGTGVGRRLCEQLDAIARHAGATEMVVSATPSENTVRFYLGRGFRPMAEPLPELFEIEPDDVHLHKSL